MHVFCSLVFGARAKWKWWTPQDVRVAHAWALGLHAARRRMSSAVMHTSFHFCRAELKFRPCRLGARNSRLMPAKVARDIMGSPKSFCARLFSARWFIVLSPEFIMQMRPGLFPLTGRVDGNLSKCKKYRFVVTLSFVLLPTSWQLKI